jgi:hypothetical protein
MRPFYFWLEMPQANQTEGVSALCATGASAEGTQYANHVPTRGALAFRTFANGKRGLATVSSNGIHTEILTLVAQRNNELALTKARLTQVEAQNELLRLHAEALASGQTASEGVGALVAGGLTRKAWFILRSRGPIGLAREARNYVHWRLTFARPRYRRYERGTVANPFLKTWFVVRHEGLLGLRAELRRYARWEISRRRNPAKHYPVPENANLVTKTLTVLRHEGFSGFRREVRNFVYWKLAH